MSDVLHGIEDDVRFDSGAADSLSTACEHAASAIQSQYGSRASWVSTAMTDFKGYFSGLFRDNANTARVDAAELVDRLQELAKGARRLKQEAEKEQKRRETARKWKKEQDDRSLWDKGVDSVFGEDKPPVGPAAEPVNIPISAPRSAPRTVPPPGSGGGGSGGTSSAKPSDLTTFATNSAHANDALHPNLASVRSDLASFHSRCHWGTLDGSGVVTGFTKWLAANDEDVQWAKLVADAFSRAGGSGGVKTLSNSALLATLASHGVDASRADLTIAGPVAVGHPPTTGYAMDPVNTSTGNFVETETDLAFAGACSQLALTRTYNSLVQGRALDVGTAGFGPGWSSWTDASLRFDDQQARMVLPDGRQIEFARLGAGWDRATGESLWLEASGSTYVARDNAGTTWTFGADGLLLEQSTGPGTAIALTWVERRLVRLAHERGRRVELTWSESGPERITALLASDGRRVDFDYDESGRLVAATGPLGTRTYRWDDASGFLSAVVSADGVVEADNVYDDQGRVVRQRSAHGREVRFVYLPGRVTVVSDEDGNRSNTWIADQRGRLVGVVDADEQRQSMAYDSHGDLVVVTERDGSTTVREYDERGRLVRTVAATGTDVRQTWDEHDRLVTVSAAAAAGEDPATTRFEYAAEADRQPSVILDPEGGRTAMEWRDGLLLRVTDPTGVVVRFEHDEHGDLVATSDALGATARLERDAAGRVVAASTPSGATTRFDYDPASGLISSRTDPDGAVTRFEHTAAGRLRAVTDPLGARTELEYSANGENTRTVDPLGRSTTRRFDDLGNVTAFELPDGTTWEFGYDAMSRLRRVTDGAGSVAAYDYDATGALTATTDPHGVRRAIATDVAQGTTELVTGPVASSARVDRLGRLVATERPDGSTLLTRYDRCGRPVEFVAADGSLTQIRRDAGGRPLVVVRPNGGEITYDYDECGRPAAVTDELGGRTSIAYDVDGRVVTETGPTGEVGTREYDECGRITKRREPGVGTSTWTYDLAGRVTETRDPRFGRRRFRYDAAGQLVEAVNGNGGSTRWEYDVNGRAVSTTDPDGGVTLREFDSMNHVVAETDPLGRTTRGGYDALGHQVWQTSPDGQRTEWSYDATGQMTSVSVDGEVVATLRHDARTRRTVVHDRTQSGTETVHELHYDPCGRLLSRTRDGRGLSWTYDAEGHRTSRTGPDGSTVTYLRDAAGRVTAVDHPLLGRASFERDASGRVLVAEAGGLRQTWRYADGFAAAHSASDGTQTTETVIDRDDLGRVVSIVRDGEHTTYDYDEACQLIEARSAQQGDLTVRSWRYDRAGRLVAEAEDGTTRELTYDAAGQLTTLRESGGRVLTFAYDPQGRRRSVAGSDGSSREFVWARTGWLSSVVDRDGSGEERRHTTVADALGELSRLDDAEVFFDTAADRPTAAQVGDTTVVATGAVTGMAQGSSSAGWSTPGWRGLRTDVTGDPWSGAPLDAGVGPAGEIGFAGMEWLGARVYDAGVRAFISVDPLDPVVGSGWSGNPYAYAGNDPLNLLDPSGLRPATDQDLTAYAAAHDGTGVGHWLENNWEYVAGGAMVLAGGVLIATGVGGPAGMMLLSAGADTIIQKATTGEVNWGEVALSGALGGVGGVGAGAASKIGLTGWKAAATAGAIDGAWQGGVAGAGGVMLGPGPHTPGEVLKGGVLGSAGGIVGGAGASAASHGITTAVVNRALSHAPVTPGLDVGAQARSLLGNPGDTVVLGRQADTAVAKDWPGHTVLSTDQWTKELNDEWVNGAIDYQRPVYVASPIEGNLVQTTGAYAGQPTIFAGELNQLRDAGYTKVGDYMMPPGAR